MKLFSSCLVLSTLACRCSTVVLAFSTTSLSTTSITTTTSALHAESSPSSGLTRRQVGELSIAALGLGGSFLATRESSPTDYGLWGVLPVGTYKQKKTIRQTIVENQVWTFDQKFGILNVQVPLRMTVLKLSTGGLFLYNPVAATPECLSLLQEIIDAHGPLRYIMVGSVALEHKVYAGVLAQKFPNAKVFLQPGQYSFPVNLPDSFLGFPARRTQPIPASIDDAPADWKADLDILTLGPFISRDGAFGETVVLHKPTETLLVTDTVLEVTKEVPAIYETDPAPLLYHARDTVTDIVQDNTETRERGWRRLVLFGLFFTPSAIDIKDAKTALEERRPDINPDFAGVYPWDWVRDDNASFDALRGGLLVAPILQTLILNRNPVEVLEFADKVSTWPFQRIIPAHLANDLKYTGKDYRQAFGFLEAKGMAPSLPNPLKADLKLLLDSSDSLIASGAIAPIPPLVGGDVSREDILKQTVYRCRANVCAQRAASS